MQENKIEFSKGIVKQAGYPEVSCKIIKAEINRKDEMKDKPLYVVESIPLKAGLYVVTPSISEALSRVERKTIGIMNEQGELLVPMNNSSIISLNDKYVACNAYDSTRSLKVDPLNFQQNINTSQEIKEKMKASANTEITFKCDNFNAKYDLYEISADNKFNKIFEGASYVAISNDTVYAHTNEVMDEVFVYGKQEIKDTAPSLPENKFEKSPIGGARIIDDENKFEMPVAAFATVQDKPLDTLETTPNFTEVKPGAPTLIEDEETKLETEPVPAKPETPQTKNVGSFIAVEDNSLAIEKDNSFTAVEEKVPEVVKESTFTAVKEKIPEVVNESTFTAVKEKVPEVAKESVFTAVADKTPEVAKESASTAVEDKTVFSPANESKEKVSDMADIAGLVSAVKGKIENSTQKIKEQEQAINRKDKEIENLKEELKKLEEENNQQTKRVEVLIKENQDLSSRTAKLEETVEGVYSAFSGLIDTPDETPNYLRKVA